MKWIHTKPESGTTKTLHGLTWTWCNTCERMGYHTPAECKNKRAALAAKKPRKEVHANTARARKNKLVIDSLSKDEQALSDLDSDTDLDDRKQSTTH